MIVMVVSKLEQDQQGKWWKGEEDKKITQLWGFEESPLALIRGIKL